MLRNFIPSIKQKSQSKTEIIWTLILSVFLINLVDVLVIPQTAQARMPNLSPEELEAESCCILLGRVKSVSSPVSDVEFSEYQQFTAVIDVKIIIKDFPKVILANPSDTYIPPINAPKPGDKIEVHYRRQNMGGKYRGGQAEELHPNTYIKLFLTIDKDKHFQLIEPNGWEGLSVH